MQLRYYLMAHIAADDDTVMLVPGSSTGVVQVPLPGEVLNVLAELAAINGKIEPFTGPAPSLAMMYSKARAALPAGGKWTLAHALDPSGQVTPPPTPINSCLVGKRWEPCNNPSAGFRLLYNAGDIIDSPVSLPVPGQAFAEFTLVIQVEQ